MGAVQVLGIPVDRALIGAWRDWFAPRKQPFRMDELRAEVADVLPVTSVDPTMEWVDTFFMYAGTWGWLHETAFMALRPSQRIALMAVRRRSVRPKKLVPVWPSELVRAGDEVIFRWIADAVRPSRHREVPAAVWRRTQHVLPDAQRLAGTFETSGSGPNCFGTVMAAAGTPDTQQVQIGPDRFQSWLDDHTEQVTGTSTDGEPGIVFAWTEHGKLAHATVTIGDGWMLSKPSQSWSSPRLVRTVREVVDKWRYPDTRLSRHRLVKRS